MKTLGHGTPLATNDCVDVNGVQRCWVTFIVHVEPCEEVHVCHVRKTLTRAASLEFGAHCDVDAQTPAAQHPVVVNGEEFELAIRLCMPLRGDTDEAWRCSQSFGGGLTHFGVNLHHAVDFDCDIGTPVVAAASGRVAFVHDGDTCSGPHAAHVVHGNRVVLDHGSGLQTHYGHLRPGSVRVASGDEVVHGQVLAESGASGLEGMLWNGGGPKCRCAKTNSPGATQPPA